MDRTVYVSMMDCNWTNSTWSFNQRMLRLQQMCSRPLPAGPNDPNPLHIVP